MGGLAIFAGRGVLPEELSARRPDALVVSFEGVGIDFEPEHHYQARFEKSGALFRKLRQVGVSDICFAGAVDRPRLNLWRLDFKTLRLMPKIREALAHSDGDALRVIRKLVENEGFSVVGAQQICPELLAGFGPLGTISPPSTDFSRAIAIQHAMSDLDIGQALVMRDGQCFAIETLPGTQAMLEFVSSQNGQGGYLFKASKLGQDWDMDMASIGPHTVQEAKDAKLDGIVLGAGRTLVLQKDETIAKANAAGLYLYGVE